MRGKVRCTTHQACNTYRDRFDTALPGMDSDILRSLTLLILMASTSTRDDVDVDVESCGVSALIPRFTNKLNSPRILR